MCCETPLGPLGCISNIVFLSVVRYVVLLSSWLKSDGRGLFHWWITGKLGLIWAAGLVLRAGTGLISYTSHIGELSRLRKARFSVLINIYFIPYSVTETVGKYPHTQKYKNPIPALKIHVSADLHVYNIFSSFWHFDVWSAFLYTIRTIKLLV